MEKHNCPVCEKADGVLSLCEVNDYVVYQCKNCGADHVFPMPDNNALKNYYDRKDWFEGGEVGGYSNYDEQTTWSLDVFKPLLDQFAGQQGLSILDIGCGYGSHLALASEQGWKCFGVEMSDHARQITKQRLGGRAYIVESVEDIIPHEFDLVLMLDVIEHLPSPYPLFYSLFSKGAITEKTKLVITTPNAGSDEARKNPAEWSYRHPPSHLVYYSDLSLRFLLEKLHFDDVSVHGMYPIDSSDKENPGFGNCGGLLVTTKGSDFTEFMRERYVPGTWSKLAEYEHMPRYELAKTLIKGKRVLDFGCGTGYGSAMLAKVAKAVTGLDIDEKAIAWARETHISPQLSFHCCNDLGESLPNASFDAVTCFEMIEHVDYETQQSVIASIARLLRNDGTLIISTPNPEITDLYGENPYHLREMTLVEFRDLLAAHFPFIRILEQRVQNSITFDEVGSNQESLSRSTLNKESGVVPLAFIALCSRAPIADINSLVVFDEEMDLINDTLSREKKLNLARFEAYSFSELEPRLRKQDAVVAQQAQEIDQLNEMIQIKAAEISKKNKEILRIRQSKWFRLGNALKMRPTPRNIARIAYLFVCLIVPEKVRNLVAPIVLRFRQRQLSSPQVSIEEMVKNGAYLVKPPSKVAPDRKCVIHVIANFMTGGSSRLVVDLIEHLGDQYNQKVLTGFIPNPPAYVGLEIEKCRFPKDSTPFLEYFRRNRPDFVHVHYWGETDKPWYAKAIEAAETLGIPVIENVNTPVAPYLSDTVVRYVYVSDYVRHVFGQEDTRHIKIYPGSDFSRFSRDPHEKLPDDCVGMVYRLEDDKLNEKSIEPFIRIAQRRPQTRILIIGGGSLLAPFQNAVELAGVEDCFEFTGYVRYEALPEYYRRMSLFIAPVWKESFGQVSSFAMNMRIPVIGYDVDALGEVLGDPKLLAPPTDSEKLADIAIELLDSPGLRESIGQRQAARTQEYFSIQAMIKSYAALYGEIGNTHKVPAS